MIVVCKYTAADEELQALQNWLSAKGVSFRSEENAGRKLLLLEGEKLPEEDAILAFAAVEEISGNGPAYKLADRNAKPGRSTVKVGSATIGDGGFTVIAGPCTVESAGQMETVAAAVKNAGCTILRGGAFKPRTSPYTFQGMGAEGISLLVSEGKKTGLPVVAEIMSAAQLPLFDEVDMLQVGARNMQNFDLLKALGKCGKPVLLKRGHAATLKELLLSAEYILSGGNEQVVLCERGIRTFEGATRNTLDLSAVPALREMTHLPILVDPSHGTGHASFVKPMAMAAAAAGADGIMLEVHPSPVDAKCDGMQALDCAALADTVRAVRAITDTLKSL